MGQFNDQRTHIPNYFRELRRGENAKNLYSDEQNRREHTIPQLDGIADSNTSSSITTDNIDLTVSPLKPKATFTDKHARNLDLMILMKYRLKIEGKLDIVRKTKELVNPVPELTSTPQLNDNITKGQESTDKTTKAKDDQTQPNRSKGRVIRTYQLDHQKKELLRQR